jgi:UrcA family protein
VKIFVVLSLLGTAACVGTGYTERPVPGMSVACRDLALETVAGRRELARRVAGSAAAFCEEYDSHDARMIFDVRLASERNCPGAARIMLLQRAPAKIRRAYLAGRTGR